MDVFIVLGAAVWEGGVPSNAMRRRVEGAFASARTSAHPCFLLTGGVGKFPPSEACVMRGLLRERGVGDDAILLDEESYDTLDSVRNCARILRRMPKVGNVVVCTDRYHLLRTRWLFYLCGVQTSAGSVASGRRQTGLRRWLYYCLREVPATVQDTFLILAFR